jgi:hypothetical protein
MRLKTWQAISAPPYPRLEASSARSAGHARERTSRDARPWRAAWEASAATGTGSDASSLRTQMRGGVGEPTTGDVSDTVQHCRRRRRRVTERERENEQMRQRRGATNSSRTTPPVCPPCAGRENASSLGTSFSRVWNYELTRQRHYENCRRRRRMTQKERENERMRQRRGATISLRRRQCVPSAPCAG